jgi:thymidylate synthase
MSELIYLNALKDILENGEERTTRNSVTLSKFGISLEFDISKSFPLLTSKKIYWKGVLNELLWFLNGNTNANILRNSGVHIWDANSSRDFLNSRKLEHYDEGDCGPIYGFQWRHYNAQYNGCNSNYAGKGIDQLNQCIELIKTDPTSRRIFMSAWNPEQLDEMCLPPCHVSYQFYVSNNRELSCITYQRSGDMFLGVPFNIASTACLVYIIAHLTNCTPGKIILNIGDAHVYTSHIDSVKKQLNNMYKLYDFPILTIKSRGQSTVEDYIDTDFEISNYICNPGIKSTMVA